MNARSNQFALSVAQPLVGAPSYTDGLTNFESRLLSTSSGHNDLETAIINAGLGYTGAVNEHLDKLLGTSWSGGVGVSADGKLYIIGGGHDSSVFNGIIMFNANGDAFPSGFSVVPGSATPAALAPVGEDGTAYLVYVDGKPTSYHTYHGVHYDRDSNELLMLGIFGFEVGTGAEHFWKFNLNTNQWVQMPDQPLVSSSQSSTRAVWDQDSRKMWYSTRSNVECAIFNSATNIWSAPILLGGGPSAFPDGESPLGFDSRRKRVYALSPGAFRRWDVDFSNDSQVEVAWSGPTGPGSQVFQYAETLYFDQHPTDPTLDRFWCFGGQTGVYGKSNIVEMNATTYVCQTYPITGDLLTSAEYPDDNGTYDRMLWKPEWGGVFNVLRHDQGAHFIKVPLYPTPGDYTAPGVAGNFSISGFAGSLEASGDYIAPGIAGSFGVTGFAGALSSGAESELQIRVSGNGRFLETPSGTPWLANGDTAWTLVNELSRAQVTQYFADCQANGINTVMWEMIQSSTGYSAGAPNNAEGNAPFTTPNDFSTQNEIYWEYIDFVVDEAAAHGIVNFVFPSYLGFGGGLDGWLSAMKTEGVANMAAFGTWIADRYKDKPNIIWCGGGDTAASADGQTAVDVHNAMMNAIKASDPNHIATAHSARNQSALDDYDEAWLDLNSTYSNLSNQLIESETDWNRIATAPTFFLEGDYQPDISDQQARQQAYEHVIGGGSGHIYGHHTIWDFNSGWETALATPGRSTLLYFKNLFDSRPYQDIVPDYSHTVVTAGYGDFTNGFAVMSGVGNGGDTLLAYFPSTSYTITVDMTQIGGSTVDAYWYNVRDGSANFEANYATTGTRQFTPPSSGDWVLVMDNAALSLGAPG